MGYAFLVIHVDGTSAEDISNEMFVSWSYGLSEQGRFPFEGKLTTAWIGLEKFDSAAIYLYDGELEFPWLGIAFGGMGNIADLEEGVDNERSKELAATLDVLIQNLHSTFQPHMEDPEESMFEPVIIHNDQYAVGRYRMTPRDVKKFIDAVWNRIKGITPNTLN